MGRLIKVCHVIRRFVPSEWGGIESVVLHLSKELHNRGISSSILTTKMLSQVDRETIEGVAVRRYNYCFPWFFLSQQAKNQMAYKGGSPMSLSLLWALLREKDLSIIHTHSQLRLGGIARFVARWRSIPYVVSLHSGRKTLPDSCSREMMQPFENKFEWGKIFGFLLGSRRTLKDADAIICVGRDEYDLMLRQYPKKRVEYFPNGVLAREFEGGDPSLFREKYDLTEADKLLLCVSRIDPQKNQVLLIKAFAQFAHTHPEYRLALVGPITVEQYYHEIQHLITKLGIEDKVLLIPGYAPGNPLLASAFKAAECFVLPSKNEPFGIVVLEAWAAGTPVIASKVGGLPGFATDGRDILFFDENNEGLLVERMETLHQNPELRETLVANGRAEVRQYSWETLSARLVELYDSLIDEKERG